MLYVQRFGMWRRLSLGPFSPGLQVLYGRNEAGKTTLREFIKFVLFGAEEQTGRFLSAANPREFSSGGDRGLAGGKVVCVHNDQVYHIRRLFLVDSPGGNAGELRTAYSKRAFSSVGEIFPAEFPPDLLVRLYFLELREIQGLAVLGRKELADLLFRTSVTLLGMPLSEVLDAFRRRREGIWGTDFSPSGLKSSAQELERLRSELSRLVAETEQAKAIAGHLEKLREEESSLLGEMDALSEKIARWEEALRLCPLWQERARLQAELDTLGDVPPAAPQGAHRLEKACSLAELYRQKKEQLTKRIEHAAAEIAYLSLPKDYPDLLKQVRRLVRRAGTLCELENRLAAAQVKNANLHARWQSFLSRLPASVQESAGLMVRLKRKHHRQLCHLAEAVSEKAAQWAKMTAQYAEAKAQVEEARYRLIGFLNGLSPEELPKKIHELSEKIHLLRQQSLQVQRRRELVELERMIAAEYQRLAERPPISPPLRSLLRVAFGGSTTAVLASLFTPASWLGGLGWPLLGLGGIGLSSVVLIRYFAETSHARQLAACRYQLEQIRECLTGSPGTTLPAGNHAPSLTGAQAAGASLEKSMPQSAENKSAQEDLASLERELKQLQTLAPQQAALQRQTEQVQALGKQLEELGKELADLREEWASLLGKLGLPEDFPVEDYLSIVGRFPRMCQLHRHLVRATVRYRKLAGWRDHWHARLAPVEHRLGVEPSPSAEQAPSLGQRITTLQRAAKELMQKRRKLASLQAKKRKLRQTLAAVTRRAKRVEGQITRILQGFGVEKPEDLRQLAEKAQRAASLQERIRQLTVELDKALPPAQEAEIREILERFSLAEIEVHLQELRKQQSTLAAKLTEIREASAKYHHQWEALSGPGSWWETKARLSQIRRRISRLLEEDITVTAAEKAFLRSLERYQQEYQPEALRLASGLLAKVTEGRYCRIWAPLDSQTLLVEDQLGRQWSIEQLSTGTCEQILICLRLALVSLVASRGIHLPLVLDDVFVNFDKVRVKAAAKMVTEWAADSQQVLLFTCHPHIAREFFRLGVPIFRLPGVKPQKAGEGEESRIRLRPIRPPRRANHLAEVELLPAGSAGQRQPRPQQTESAPERPSERASTKAIAGSAGRAGSTPVAIGERSQEEVKSPVPAGSLEEEQSQSPLRKLPVFSPNSRDVHELARHNGVSPSSESTNSAVVVHDRAERGSVELPPADFSTREAADFPPAKPEFPGSGEDLSRGHVPSGTVPSRSGGVRLRVYMDTDEEQAELGLTDSFDNSGSQGVSSGLVGADRQLLPPPDALPQEASEPPPAIAPSVERQADGTVLEVAKELSSYPATQNSSFAGECPPSASSAGQGTCEEALKQCPNVPNVARNSPLGVAGRSSLKKRRHEKSPSTTGGKGKTERDARTKTNEPASEKEPPSDLPPPTAGNRRVVPRVEYHGNHQGSFDAYGRRLGPG